MKKKHYWQHLFNNWNNELSQSLEYFLIYIEIVKFIKQNQRVRIRVSKIWVREIQGNFVGKTLSMQDQNPSERDSIQIILEKLKFKTSISL